MGIPQEGDVSSSDEFWVSGWETMPATEKYNLNQVSDHVSPYPNIDYSIPHMSMCYTIPVSSCLSMSRPAVHWAFQGCVPPIKFHSTVANLGFPKLGVPSLGVP